MNDVIPHRVKDSVRNLLCAHDTRSKIPKVYPVGKTQKIRKASLKLSPWWPIRCLYGRKHL
jgi:hypothetical protein